MSSFTDKYIADTYKGVIHSGGVEIPETGRSRLYDGAGNSTALSIGRTGQGIEVDGPLKVGSLTYAQDNGGAGVGALVTHVAPNVLGLQEAKENEASQDTTPVAEREAEETSSEGESGEEEETPVIANRTPRGQEVRTALG